MHKLSDVLVINFKKKSICSYQLGQGLGKSKQGRLEPVPIILLPPRMSLDACMQLKLKKGVRSINVNKYKFFFQYSCFLLYKKIELQHVNFYL